MATCLSSRPFEHMLGAPPSAGASQEGSFPLRSGRRCLWPKTTRASSTRSGPWRVQRPACDGPDQLPQRPTVCQRPHDAGFTRTPRMPRARSRGAAWLLYDRADGVVVAACVVDRGARLVVTRERSRRDEILAVASEMFHHHGYEATRIDDIGEAVGIRGPSLYRHFASKQEILDAIVLGGKAEYLAKVQQLCKSGLEPQDLVLRLIEARVDLALQAPILQFYLRTAENRYLSDGAKRQLAAMYDLYTTEWMRALAPLRPETPTAELLTAVIAAHNVIGFTPSQAPPMDKQELKEMLVRMALAVLVVEEPTTQRI